MYISFYFEYRSAVSEPCPPVPSCQTCIYVYMYICIYVYMYILCMYISIYLKCRSVASEP